METKVCTKCPENGKQPLENFRTSHNKGVTYQLSYCKKCQNKQSHIAHLKRMKKDPEKREKWLAIKREADKDYYSRVWKNWLETEEGRIYQKQQREKYKDKRVARHKEGPTEMADWYIRKMLKGKSGLSAVDIPKELIELQRKQLKLKRYAKAIKENQCH